MYKYKRAVVYVLEDCIKMEIVVLTNYSAFHGFHHVEGGDHVIVEVKSLHLRYQSRQGFHR
jgi:stress-induced morphogen